MSRIKQSKYKLSRRIGKAVWGTAKDPVSKGRIHPPGMHGVTKGANRRTTDYGNQLSAKQLLKGYYGNMTEKQFRSLFKKAVNQKGDTSENLIGLLESRLATVVYRANFAPTVFAARQLVSHKHIQVNGKTVNIPSYQLKIGDVVSVKDSSKQIPIVAEALQNKERDTPDYYEADDSAAKASLTRTPKLSDVPYPVEMEPQLVIEFYSR